MGQGRRGVALTHVIVAVVIVAVVCILLVAVAIGLSAGAASKKTARTALCLSNMKQMGVGTMSYAADYKDRFATYSWRANLQGDASARGEADPQYLAYPRALEEARSDVEAAGLQAMAIIARRANVPPTSLRAPPDWTPHFEFPHLVLSDYLGGPLPDRITVCPSDAARVRWTANPPNPANPPTDPLWRYSSSYNGVAALFTPDKFTDDGGMLRQGKDQHTIAGTQGGVVGAAPKYRLGGRVVSHVQYPSMKVMYHEAADGHRSPDPVYFTDPAATINAVFCDGSVRGVKTGEANPGGYARADGTAERPATISYVARIGLGDPAWVSKASPDQPGRYRWTLRGLRGVDVGGPEAER